MSSNEVDEWLEAGRHDIDTVHLLIREKGHPDIIIYHIHQGVEKMIKAVLSDVMRPLKRVTGLINC